MKTECSSCRRFIWTEHGVGFCPECSADEPADMTGRRIYINGKRVDDRKPVPAPSPEET